MISKNEAWIKSVTRLSGLSYSLDFFFSPENGVGGRGRERTRIWNASERMSVNHLFVFLQILDVGIKINFLLCPFSDSSKMTVMMMVMM